MIRGIVPVGSTVDAPTCRSAMAVRWFEPLQKTVVDHDLVIGSAEAKLEIGAKWPILLLTSAGRLRFEQGNGWSC
jgi:hypothetical protein